MNIKKAFFVETDEDGSGEIVWSPTEEKATKGFDGWYRVEREPDFDKFQEQGWIPAEDWIKWGGWLNCPNCEQMVSPDLWDYDKDEPMQPVYVKSDAYCSIDCRDRVLKKAKQTREYREHILQECIDSIPPCFRPVINNYFYSTSSSRIELVSNGLNIEGKIYWDAEKPRELTIEARDVDRYKEWEISYLNSK